MGLLRRILGITRDKYNLEALVSMRRLEPVSTPGRAVHIICDLDKTYVETEFESWVKMARIPFERPHEKITVPGASEVLLAARWANREAGEAESSPGLHFVSSSPPQIRAALEGKLVLDQLDWTSDTFKNQSYNLRMARVDLLRHHIAYKSQAILRIIADVAPGSSIWMIGDNAEYDPYIYTGIQLFVEKMIDIQGFAGWLRSARVESRVVDQVIQNLGAIPSDVRVAGMLIRKLPGYPIVEQPPLTQRIFLFDHWLQIAWVWLVQGLIPTASWWPLLRSFHNIHGVPLDHLEWILLAKVNTLGADHRLRDCLMQTIHRLRELRGHEPPRKTLEWAFDALPHAPANVPDSAAIQDMAMRWYSNVESARAMRSSR